jgi:hypothetical protein
MVVDDGISMTASIALRLSPEPVLVMTHARWDNHPCAPGQGSRDQHAQPGCHEGDERATWLLNERGESPEDRGCSQHQRETGEIDADHPIAAATNTRHPTQGRPAPASDLPPAGRRTHRGAWTPGLCMSIRNARALRPLAALCKSLDGRLTELTGRSPCSTPGNRFARAPGAGRHRRLDDSRWPSEVGGLTGLLLGGRVGGCLSCRFIRAGDGLADRLVSPSV